MLRGDGGDGVLVNELLFSVGVDHYDKGVKPGDVPANLKPVHQKNGDGAALPAQLGEDDFLQIVVGLWHR